MSDSPADALVLCAGCLPATPFRDYVDAAASAGFHAITVWPLTYRRALGREGLDAPTMRRMVDDVGLRITDLDPCGDWLPTPTGDDVPAMFRSVWSRHEFLDCATALGVECLCAVQLTPDPVPHDLAVTGFAQLCDDAAEHGLRVQLEFMPFSGIADLATALRIVTDADRPNAGLVIDLCHFARSGGDDAALTRVPPVLVTAIQLGDGPGTAPADLRDEAMFRRALPGDGDFALSRRLAILAGAGARCGVGPELYQRGFSEREPRVVAADLMAATRRVLTT